MPALTLVVDGYKITVALPQCTILDTKVDVQRSYVYDVRRSLVLSPEALHLQSVAERQAFEDIQQTAIQAGLIDQAQREAKILIRCFLEAAGFRTVEFGETTPTTGAAV